MTAIGYIRVSTGEQAESGLGLSAQRERIEAYCRMKGLPLRRIVSDEGVSGGKPLAVRAGGADLLAALGARSASAVVVLKLDRAFRNAGDCLATTEQWDRQGIALHIVDLGGNSIDTTTAAGKFMLTVLAGAAEMERNLTAERTKAALRVKSQRGERVSGKIPYGFKLDSDGATLVEDDGERAIIEDIVRMRRQGRTLRAICDALAQRGITNRAGGCWTHQRVSKLLARERNRTNGKTTTQAAG